ncbi:hypothetical protein EIP86_003868 [Pleurotus ostreatoroseus]|nr:hypothetical protein EIP86_003868 [Pleurotus ostreatoroseus]
MPTNFVFISFYFILPKRKAGLSKFGIVLTETASVFLNSLLATLNAREKLRDTGSGIVSIPLSTSVSSPLRTARKTELSRRSSDQMVEIQVETTTDRKTDSMSHMPQASFSGMYGSRSWQEQSRFASSGDIRSESAHIQ